LAVSSPALSHVRFIIVVRNQNRDGFAERRLDDGFRDGFGGPNGQPHPCHADARLRDMLIGRTVSCDDHGSADDDCDPAAMILGRVATIMGRVSGPVAINVVRPRR
jgi:hypothetical protein